MLTQVGEDRPGTLVLGAHRSLTLASNYSVATLVCVYG
jgi:hypothetical protein